MRTLWVGPAVFLLVITLAAAAIDSLPKKPYFEAEKIGSNVKDFNDLTDRFKKIADEKGALYAFEILRRANLAPNTDFHLLGHVVGDELYKQQGMAGIVDCTQEFRNACSHSMVIGALTEFGDGAETVRKIEETCKKAPGGLGAYTMCFHGLGHGVFAYYGYDLQKTVDFCHRAGDPAYGGNDSDQCVGGAIMELMGGGGHDHSQWLLSRERYLSDDRPLSPCLDAFIPDGAKTFCFTYLTPRLFQLSGIDLGNPDPALFAEAFHYCDAIPASEKRLRDSCFGGFGKEFVPIAGGRDIRGMDKFSDEQYQKAASWCSYASTAGQNACIEQELESIFWGGENDTSASVRFCSLVPQELQGACYTRLSDDIRKYLEGEKRRSWCSAIPEKFRAACQTDEPVKKTEL